MENNYSNIIAPSDGVRRFLCKTSVLMAGLISAVYCVCAFRMTMIEAGALGSTLRSNVLYAAYILFPLGIITAAVFARVKSMGLAFSMLSLLAAMAASLMLFLNSFASLLREQRLTGVTGGLLEFLTFGAFFALLVNLVMSCMDFKIQPMMGLIGAFFAAPSLVVTSVRTMLSFNALDFAWKPVFEWSNLRTMTEADNLRYHASWIFRSVIRSDAKWLRMMFEWRFYERIGACLLYAFMLMVFLKYLKEMKAFNKLLEHAGEYVDIPTARIPQAIFGSGGRDEAAPSEAEEVRQGKSSGSLRWRLLNLANMTKAKEKGMDISDLAEEYDAQRAADFGDLDADYGENEVPDVESDDELTEEERYIMENRRRRARRSEELREESDESRRRQDEFGEERPRPRRRQDEFGEERPRPRSRQDEFGEERPRPRRRQDEFGEERPRPRRRQDEFGGERPRPHRDDERNEQRRRQNRAAENELTDQEKYLMEERRRRQGRRLQEENSRRGSGRSDDRSRYY